ncbi:transcriptional regulator swi6 [Entophlyctis sp. JEL0112]|nr:transcriptional regulator swi6 [Entophlyctis sp. JEL0112]
MTPVAASATASSARSPHKPEAEQDGVVEVAPVEADDEQPNSDNDGEPDDNNDLDDIDNDSDSDDASPVSPKPHATANPTSKHVYTAVYSGIPVYEMMFRGVQIMRRIADGWLNATHILKAAAYSKPRRTKILEQEVLQGVHEKVQGGYGKYQGTWVPKEDGVKLARRHRVEALLRPIIDFEPENGDVALSKLNFNLKHASGSTSGKLLKPTANLEVSERPRRGGSESPAPPVTRGSANASMPTSPVPSPASRHRVTQNSYSGNIPVVPHPLQTYSAPQTPPAVPMKRPVGRPPRIPRQPGYVPPVKAAASSKPPVQKSRRMSYGYIDVPLSPPGVQMRMDMELGNVMYLNTPPLPSADETLHEMATLVCDPSSNKPKRSVNPLELSSSPPFKDISTSAMTRDELQRHIISQIYIGAPIPEILSMLRDNNLTLEMEDPNEGEDENLHSTPQLISAKSQASGSAELPESTRFILPPINANMILDSRQQTPLHWAAQFARTDLVAALLAHGANACAPTLGALETPLMRASTAHTAYNAGCFSDVIALLGAPSARCIDSRGRNILHLIAGITIDRRGGTNFWRNVQEDYMRCVFDWIDEGGFVSWVEHSPTLDYKANVKSAVAAFVNAKDLNGNTALHIALSTGSRKVAQMLVKLGAGLDVTNRVGKSPREMCEGEGIQLVESFDAGVSNEHKPDFTESYGQNGMESFLFDMQMLVAQPELGALHSSQQRLEKLRQRAGDTNRLLKQSLNTALVLARSLDSSQADASPRTSVTVTSSDNSQSSSPTKPGIPKIEILPAPPSTLVTELGSPRLSLADPTSSTPLRQLSGALLPTPPTTVKLSNTISNAQVTASSTLMAEKLREKVEESEKLRKRIFGEIESVWERREDKTRRYKRLLADACNVDLSKVSDALESN